jgi:ribose-phosphate pyrophosphokinase
MDLHASQIQGFFDIPVDNLLGNPIFTEHFIKRYQNDHDNTIVVSPDVGSVARARAFAQKLGMGLAIVDKRRQKANSSEVMNIIGEVRDKRVILFDDMVDTGGSICGAAKALVDVGGATEVFACASHGVLSGPAVERIENSLIKEIIFLDTIPPRPDIKCDKIRYLSWPTCLPRPSSISMRKYRFPAFQLTVRSGDEAQASAFLLRGELCSFSSPRRRRRLAGDRSGQPRRTHTGTPATTPGFW